MVGPQWYGFYPINHGILRIHGNYRPGPGTKKLQTTHIHGRYNGRILGKKSEIRPNALFWSEFGGILRSLEKFGGI